MSAGRARRRLLAWHRYVQRTGTYGRGTASGYHHGHVLAYDRVIFAGRPALGIRMPWRPRWARPRKA